eukprot:214045-Hanusia_phi.AAC.1
MYGKQTVGSCNREPAPYHAACQVKLLPSSRAPGPGVPLRCSVATVHSEGSGSCQTHTVRYGWPNH